MFSALVIDFSQIQVISFDCAQTLLEVQWNPAHHICASAKSLDLTFDKERGMTAFRDLFNSRFQDYCAMNRKGRQEASDEYWLRLIADWMTLMELPIDRSREVFDAGEQALYGHPSQVFSIYADVIPTLEALKKLNIKMCVVSNWDVSLRKVLKRFAIEEFFVDVIASFVLGVHKPDPKIFHHLAANLKVNPAEILHVGDSFEDDFQAARSAGLQSVWLNREGSDNPSSISSLEQILPKVAN